MAAVAGVVRVENTAMLVRPAEFTPIDFTSTTEAGSRAQRGGRRAPSRPHAHSVHSVHSGNSGNSPRRQRLRGRPRSPSPPVSPQRRRPVERRHDTLVRRSEWITTECLPEQTLRSTSGLSSTGAAPGFPSLHFPMAAGAAALLWPPPSYQPPMPLPQPLAQPTPLPNSTIVCPPPPPAPGPTVEALSHTLSLLEAALKSSTITSNNNVVTEDCVNGNVVTRDCVNASVQGSGLNVPNQGMIGRVADRRDQRTGKRHSADLHFVPPGTSSQPPSCADELAARARSLGKCVRCRRGLLEYFDPGSRQWTLNRHLSDLSQHIFPASTLNFDPHADVRDRQLVCAKCALPSERAAADTPSPSRSAKRCENARGGRSEPDDHEEYEHHVGSPASTKSNSPGHVRLCGVRVRIQQKDCPTQSPAPPLVDEVEEYDPSNPSLHV